MTSTRFTLLLLLGILLMLCLQLLINVIWFKKTSLSKALEEMEHSSSPNMQKIMKREKSQKKYILLWNRWWKSDYWWITELANHQNYLHKIGCPEKRCEIIPVNHRDTKPIEDYDVIVFHGIELKKKAEESLPTVRKPHQIYVYAGVESPRPYWNNLFQYTDYFNYTMTYRLDSDTLWHYLKIKDLRTNTLVAPSKHVKWRQPDENFFDQSLLEKAKSKTNDMVWIVSHCNAPSKRDHFFQELREKLNVSRFGKCENRECNSLDCDQYDLKYYFYATFENTLCRDWLSEKLIRALKHDIVPVVYGGANYSYFAPPKSYIDANNFRDVTELANYLKYLIKHPEEYIKYFWWRKYYSVEAYKEPFCSLCQKLYRDRIQERTTVYKNIRKWWNKGLCTQYPKIHLRIEDQ